MTTACRARGPTASSALPGGVYFAAFSSRFTNSCSSRIASTETSGQVGRKVMRTGRSAAGSRAASARRRPSPPAGPISLRRRARPTRVASCRAGSSPAAPDARPLRRWCRAARRSPGGRLGARSRSVSRRR